MKQTLLTGLLALALGTAFAKIPPPVLDDAAKAKAAETAAKTAWQAKVDGYALCKAQDKVAAVYMKTAGKPMAAPAKDAKAAAAPTPAAQTPAAAASGTPGPSGTPVAFAPPPPCLDPGPFAYNPPAQKPLETSGAHSPTGTAASPPSVKQNSAEMTAGKTGGAPAPAKK
ncbi:MAG TPA: hypothetical protein VK996_17445 [Ramlibacter sp.]|nr:hypothetical protein [Ramlibacter sp.]